MSKVIIGIHGLGNKPPKKILKKWWKKSIQEGLQLIDDPRLFFKFELVYWANLLHPFSLNPKIIDKKNPAFLKEPYVPCLNYVRKMPGQLRRKLLDYLEKQIDKAFLKPDLSIHFSSVSDLIIHRFFKDLDAYYSQTCINFKGKERLVKDVIRDQLARIIKKYKRHDILLIGHSMGSLIAYDVLTQTVPEIKIDTFITIGSPLGSPVIMSKIASEQRQKFIKKASLSTPENVIRNWYNFSDLKDRVAMNYSLSDDYQENSHQVRAIDKVVCNDYEYNRRKNPHKIYGYLRTPEFAEVVHEFLNHGKCKASIWFSDKTNFYLAKFIKIKKRIVDRFVDKNVKGTNEP